MSKEEYAIWISFIHRAEYVLERCHEQNSLMEAYAYQGAITFVIFALAELKCKSPGQHVLIEKLDFLESSISEKTENFQFDIKEHAEILEIKDCEDENILYYARQYAKNSLMLTLEYLLSLDEKDFNSIQMIKNILSSKSYS